MSKNLIPEIAKMLGVDLGEEFKIDTSGDDIFRITESGVWMRKSIDKEEWLEKAFEFVMLCNGDAEIIKLPWKPKYKDKYWTFYINDHDKLDINWSIWTEEVAELARLKAGWVYRTQEEAKAALPAVAKEMNVEFIV